MTEKYYTSLAFWTMGNKYLNLSRGVCEHIIRNRNRYMLISAHQLTLKEFERKTKWNDVNMVIPLLFNFYHGLELMLKGFVLFSEGGNVKLDHKITELYRKFHTHYTDQKNLINLFGRYINKSQMPELLYEFLDHNKLSVNRFYESLRYPFNNSLTKEYQHYTLKYKSNDGIEFYRALKKDINKMKKLTASLGHSLKK
jgi:hypothetical protein